MGKGLGLGSAGTRVGGWDRRGKGMRLGKEREREISGEKHEI